MGMRPASRMGEDPDPNEVIRGIVMYLVYLATIVAAVCVGIWIMR